MKEPQDLESAFDAEASGESKMRDAATIDQEVEMLRSLDARFRRLHESSGALVQLVSAEKLYWQPRETSTFVPVYSCGEHILRSAGSVEQTFGGIMANLWDDPFEWTLPETLAAPEQVIGYLEEVEATRQSGFQLLKRDEELTKRIVVASGEVQSLFRLLIETLAKATHHQGQAFAVFRLFSDARVPRV